MFQNLKISFFNNSNVYCENMAKIFKKIQGPKRKNKRKKNFKRMKKQKKIKSRNKGLHLKKRKQQIKETSA